MAKFDPRKVEPIDYDFTDIDLYDAEAGTIGADGAKCSGEGTVPEPSGDALDALTEAVNAIRAKAGTKKGLTIVEARKLYTDAFVDILRIPREHVDELPPRQFNAFRDYLLGELWGIADLLA